MEYAGNMKKYVENMKEYMGNMKKFRSLPLYVGPKLSSWFWDSKNSALSFFLKHRQQAKH